MFTTVPMKSAPDLDTPVTEVMHRGLVTLPATATLADAAAAMRDKGVHAVLVEDAAAGTRLGWVTSRGVLHNHARDWTIADSLAAAVTEAPADVALTATLADAIDAFVGSGASHVLVTAQDGAVVGVIAESDLVAFLAR
jgi:CBS domain-containing protein